MSKEETSIIRELIYRDLTISNIEAANILGVHYTSVWKWRKKNLNKSNGIKRRRFTDRDLLIMRDTSLNNVEVANKLGRTVDGIRMARKKYLTEYEINSKKNGVNKGVEDDFNKGKEYTMYEIKEIVNSNLNNKEIAIMFGRNSASISDIKQRYKHLKEV